jgi:hypothetical protein
MQGSPVCRAHGSLYNYRIRNLIDQVELQGAQLGNKIRELLADEPVAV